MNKWAFLVGLDKYAVPENNLNGCINDIRDIYKLLIQDYGFKPDNIRTLANKRATQGNIIKRLEWLVKSAKPGDDAFFYFSGHGSRVRDRNGDELKDHMDELFCTYELNWDDPLLDDKVGQILSGIKNGVFLTVIADCCHSGTITRSAPSPAHVPVGGKIRYVDPPFDIESRHIGRGLKQNTFKGCLVPKFGHILLSGCAPNQTSAESRMSNGDIRGALTYHLAEILRSKKYKSWVAVHKAVCSILNKQGFQQDPQLYGTKRLKRRSPFGI